MPDKQKPLIDRVSNADYFSDKLAKALVHFDKSKGITKDKAVKECSEYLSLTLNDYMDFVGAEEKIYVDRYVTEAIRWYDTAYYAINKAAKTIVEEKSTEPNFDEDYYKEIAIYLCSQVSGSLTYLITSQSKMLGWKIHFVMPYNMIGSGFSDKAKIAAEKYILSPSEHQCVDYSDNVHVFMGFFLDIVKGIEEMAKQKEDYESEIREYVSWVKKVAEDYMCRLIESKPDDPRQFPAQIRLWLWKTRIFYSLTLDNEIIWVKCKPKPEYVFSKEEIEANERALLAIEKTRSLLMPLLDEFDSSMESYAFDVISSKVEEIRTKAREQKSQLDSGPSVDTQEDSCGIAFSSHLSPEAKNTVKAKIGQELQNKPGYKGLVYIRAAILENYITEPSYPEVMKTYPTIKTKEQNFSSFLGVTGKFVINITDKNQELLDNAREQLKLLVNKVSE